MRQVKNINTFPWWTTQNFTKNDVEKNRFEFLPFQSYQKSCSSAKENTTKTKSFVKFLLNSTTIQIQKVIQVLFSTSFLRWRQNIALPFEVGKNAFNCLRFALFSSAIEGKKRIVAQKNERAIDMISTWMSAIYDSSCQ